MADTLSSSVQQDALVISVTCNACALLFLLVRPLVKWVLEKLAHRHGDTMRRWRDFQDFYPWILPKFITEQLLTLVLILLAVCALVFCSVMDSPFLALHQHPAVFTLFAVNIGRYTFRLVQGIFILREKPHSFWISVIHHLVTLSFYVTAVLHRELALGGIVGIFMEGDSLWYETARIMKRAGIPRYDTAFLVVNVIGLCVSFLLRVVLPVGLISCGLVAQNPMAMSSPSLAIFFMALVYLSSVSVYLLKASACSVRKTVTARRSHAFQLAIGPLSSPVVTKPGLAWTVNQLGLVTKVGNEKLNNYASVFKGTLPEPVSDCKLVPTANVNAHDKNMDTVSLKGTSGKPSFGHALASMYIRNQQMDSVLPY